MTGFSVAATGTARVTTPHAKAVQTGPASRSVATAHTRELTGVVQTTHGPVQGLRVSGDGYPLDSMFFGIRYGQDTGGDNRWLPPKPANWTDVFDATTFGPIAPQSVINGEGIDDPDLMNEDCLRLNIWMRRPTTDSGPWSCSSTVAASPRATLPGRGSRASGSLRTAWSTST